MKHAILTSFLVGLLAVTAWAQDEGDQEQQRGDGSPPGRRMGRGPGERGMGGPPGRDGGPGLGRMWDRIAEELDLDEEQRAQFDEITAKYRERGQDTRQRWQELRDEMREARESGDEQRVQELREEMREGRGRPDAGFSEALEELEPILREDQVSKLWELQDRMRDRGQDRDRYRRIMSDLPDELKLTDEQRDEYEQLLQAQREEMRERWSGVRPLMEEMRKAREAGDEERIAELREELEQTRPSQEALFEGFFEDLQEILTEEQLERLAEFRRSLDQSAESGGRGKAESVRNVLQAAKRLRLESDQKEELREIEREAIRAYREIPRKNSEEHATLAREVKAEIMEILDEEQGQEFERQLSRLSGRRDQSRERGERRDRGRRRDREP